MKIKNDFVKIEITQKDGSIKTIEKRNLITNLYVQRYKNHIMQNLIGTSQPIVEMNKLFITITPQTITELSTSIINDGGVIDSQFVFGAELDSDIIYNENFLTITHRYTQLLDGSYYAIFGNIITGVGFGDINYYGTNDYLYAWLDLTEFNIVPYEGMTLNFVRQDTYYHGGITEELIPYHLCQYGIGGKYGYLDSIAIGYESPELSMTNITIDNTIVDEIKFTGDLYLNSEGIPFYPEEDLYPSEDLIPEDQKYFTLFQKYKIYNGAVDTGLFYYIKNQIKDLDETFDNEKVSLKITYERGV